MALIVGVSDLSGSHHDNSVALVHDGRLVFASQEDRFSRRKHDGRFPARALAAGLRLLGAELADIDAVVSGWPAGSFSGHLLDEHHRGQWGRLGRTAASRPGAFLRLLAHGLPEIASRAWTRRQVRRRLPGAERLFFLDHYLAHAAASYWTLQGGDGLAVVLDNAGQDEGGRYLSGAVFRITEGRFQRLATFPFAASLGAFYSSMTAALGWRPASEEGKLMALAACGDPRACRARLEGLAPRVVGGELCPGEGWADTKWRRSPALLAASRWGRAVSIALEEHGREAVAAAAQAILEERVLRLMEAWLEKERPAALYLGGGIFLNAQLNGKLRRRFALPQYLYFNPGDGGTAAGAAFVGAARLEKEAPQPARSPFSGRSFDESMVRAALDRYAGRLRVEALNDDYAPVAAALDRGELVGLFAGRAEWGPRALGARSVLADPRDEGSRDRINQRLKRREAIMPFAPAVLASEAHRYFEMQGEEPYMRSVFKSREQARSELPAVLHVDGGARVQTVETGTLCRILGAFAQRTGVPCLLNTSFNKHGEPIVETPATAIERLLEDCVDGLVLEGFWVRRLEVRRRPQEEDHA